MSLGRSNPCLPSVACLARPWQKSRRRRYASWGRFRNAWPLQERGAVLSAPFFFAFFFVGRKRRVTLRATDVFVPILSGGGDAGRMLPSGHRSPPPAWPADRRLPRDFSHGLLWMHGQPQRCERRTTLNRIADHDPVTSVPGSFPALCDDVGASPRLSESRA